MTACCVLFAGAKTMAERIEFPPLLLCVAILWPCSFSTLAIHLTSSPLLARSLAHVYTLYVPTTRNTYPHPHTHTHKHIQRISQMIYGCVCARSALIFCWLVKCTASRIPHSFSIPLPFRFESFN